MRGLLYKDLCLILQRKQTIVIFFVLALFMGLTQDPTFVLGYLCVLSGIFSIGTISYDEFDNGYPFLFTLPITRRQYVQSKYLFCLLTALTGWSFSLLLLFTLNLVNHRGEAMEWEVVFGFLLSSLLIISLMIPLQLKYGAERSRLALALAAGLAIAAAALFDSVSDLLGLDASHISAGLLASLSRLLPLLICAAALLILLLSYFRSVRIMEKKEF